MRQGRARSNKTIAIHSCRLIGSHMAKTIQEYANVHGFIGLKFSVDARNPATVLFGSAIFRCISTWNSASSKIPRLFTCLFETRKEAAFGAVISRFSDDNRVAMLKEAARYSLGQQHLEIAQSVINFLDECRKDRNTIVHSVWASGEKEMNWVMRLRPDILAHHEFFEQIASTMPTIAELERRRVIDVNDKLSASIWEIRDFENCISRNLICIEVIQDLIELLESGDVDTIKTTKNITQKLAKAPPRP